MVEALETRLKLLEDHLSLSRLVNRYFALADRLDWKGWSELFAEDGTFEIPGSEQRLRGPREIHQVVRDRFAGAFEDTQHYIANLDLQIEGDTAAGAGDLLFVALADRQAPSNFRSMGGRYNWSFVRLGRTWRVMSARNHFVWDSGSNDAEAASAKALSAG